MQFNKTKFASSCSLIVAMLQHLEVPEACMSFSNKNVSDLQDFKMNIIKWKLNFVQFWTEFKLVITNL